MAELGAIPYHRIQFAPLRRDRQAQFFLLALEERFWILWIIARSKPRIHSGLLMKRFMNSSFVIGLANGAIHLEKKWI